MARTNSWTETMVDWVDGRLRQNRFSNLWLGGGSGTHGGSSYRPIDGQLTQRHVCYDTSETASPCSPSGFSSLVDNLRRIRYWQEPATWFGVTTSGAPPSGSSLNIYIKPGLWYPSTTEYCAFAGGDSPTFTLPSGVLDRIDTVYVDPSGILHIQRGTPAVLPTITLPPIASGIPLWAVHLTPTSSGITHVECSGYYTGMGYIERDLRPFLNLGGGGAVASGVLPASNQGAILRGGLADWETYNVGAANEVLTNDGTDVIWSTGAINLTAGKTLVVSVNLTLAGVDGKSLTIEETSILNQDLTTDASVTFADIFVPDGGTFGISGNELLTVNAAGNFTFSGVTSIVVPDGAWVGADAACAWLFDSSNGDITAQDNVGIGVNPPDQELHVHGSISVTIKLTNDDTGISGNVGLDIGVGSSEKAYIWNCENTELYFGTNNTRRITILAGGNVGIGVLPNQKLTVEGTIDLKEQAAANADVASYGQIWVKNTTPNELWFTDDAGTDVQLGLGGGGLPAVAGAGYALVSDGVDSWAVDLTPLWLGTHTWGSGLSIMPTDATGQDLGDATHRWDLHTQAAYFEGATGNNVITIPDNVADALHISDVGGIEYLKIFTTNIQPIIRFNDGAADVDFEVVAIGVADALQIRGSDGQVTLGVLAAGFVKSDIGGALSTTLEVSLIDLASYAQGSIIRGGAADWETLVHPGGAGYALVSDATGIVWDQTPAWTGTHSFQAGIAFEGASGNNEITIPDNLAIALEVRDTGAIGVSLEFLRIVSTDANPYFLIDPANAGVNVGIGIAAPGGTLDVAGEIRITADDAFAADVAQVYTDATNGLVITGHAGTTYDFLITEAGGQGLFANPQGTTNVILCVSTGDVGVGVVPNQKLTVEGTASLKEQAAANADTAAYGQIWVKNTTPNELWFTDDAGADVQLGVGAWELISETVLAGNAASVTFAAIPQGYRSLVLKGQTRTDRAAESDSMLVRLNGDTGNNYDWVQLYAHAGGVVGSAGARAASSISIAYIDAAATRANNFAACDIELVGYALAGREKWVMGKQSGSFGDLSTDNDVYVVIRRGRWRNTAAVTSLTLLPDIGANFVTGSRFTLYGIL